MKRALIFVLMAALGGGCGVFKQSREESAAAAPAPASDEASSFNLRIVPAAADHPNQPDPGANLESARVVDRVVAQGATLVFVDGVRLPDPTSRQDIYFVWPDQWQGEQVKSVTVDVRSKEASASPDASPAEHIARYDSDTHRFFISLLDLFPADRTEADARAEYELRFTLICDDAKPHQLQVDVRVRAPLPPVSVREIEPVDRLSEAPGLNRETIDLSPELAGSAGRGILVHATQLENPVARPLKLWLRAGEGELELRQHVTLRTYHGEGPIDGIPSWWPWKGKPAQDAYQWHGSSGKLVVSAVEVVREGAPGGEARTERLELPALKWTQVALGASERLTLRWFAKPAPGVKSCGIPVAFPQTFAYGTLKQRCIPLQFMNTCIPAPYIDVQYQTLPRYWFLGGYRLSGQWRGDWALSNLSESEPDAQGEAVAGALHDLSFAHGFQAEDSSEPMGCQGVID